MSKILVGYSPYRSVLKQDRANQVAEQKAPAGTSEVVKIEMSPVNMMISLFVVSLVLGGLFLMDFNKNATKGYILKSLEISQQELKEQNDLKNLSLAKAKAVNQMIASGYMDNMRKPNDMQYIFGDSMIAKAD